MAAAQAAGFSPLPLFEVGDPLTVRFLVRAGLGISLVPGELARAAGAGRRRGGPSRSAAPPAVSCSRPRRATSPAGRLLHERLLEL